MKYSDITSWLSGNEAIFGVEVYVNKLLQKEFRLVHISKKNGMLFANSFATYASIEELILAIPEHAPVALVWNGKGVIHRNFSSKEESTFEIAKSLFPDVKFDDFLYQQTKTSSAGILSLIRKDLITELLSVFETKKITILSISIGPFRTAAFFQLLEQFSKDLIYDYNRIKTNSDGEIIEYEIITDRIDTIVSVGDEKIESAYINAYAGGCIYLLTANSDIYTRVEDEIIDVQLKKHKESILKRRGGLILLVSTLFLLLINFFIFSNLRKQNNTYQDELAISQSKLKQLDSLEIFIETKKDFLEKAGWIEKVIVSKECDEIAQTIPTEIRLTELTIHPINITESRNAKETIFTNKKIIIRGVTKRVIALNDWLKIVSQRASIKGLHMEEYHFDTQLQEGQFKLEGTIE